MVDMKEALTPALIAGGIFGIIGGLLDGLDLLLGLIPCIGWCLGIPLMLVGLVLPVAAGLASAFLMKKKFAVDIKDGVIAGVMAGGIGGVVLGAANVVLLVFRIILNRGVGAMLMTFVYTVVYAVGWLVAWMVMGVIGGLIGAFIFGKKQ